jgi:hypothetical protein
MKHRRYAQRVACLSCADRMNQQTTRGLAPAVWRVQIVLYEFNTEVIYAE